MARVYRQPPNYLQTNDMVSLNAELRSDANHWPHAQGEPDSAPTRRASSLLVPVTVFTLETVMHMMRL